ncbi:MAG: 4-hydroxy-tetrahydrodipicolinate reductase [Flammeovirgaceae bacterium]
MKILLIGYGKMGQTIEQIALDRGHQIVGKIDKDNLTDLANFTSDQVDVAIEFTQPESAVNNLKTCFANNIPVVCGTTGWLANRVEVESACQANEGAFFYASNFSVGVNIFFHLNKYLAKMMNAQPQYEMDIEESHHIHKKDAPSGTAITIAEGMIENLDRKETWKLEEEGKELSDNELGIISYRIDEVPGTHQVNYSCEIDSIEITHTAHSRQGFAQGALLAAEWLKGKKGIFGMDDMLDFKP